MSPYYEIGRNAIPPVRLDDGDQIAVIQVVNGLLLLMQPASDSSTGMGLDPEKARELIGALEEGIRRIEGGA